MNPLFTLGKSFDCCGIHLINGAFMFGSSRKPGGCFIVRLWK